MSFLRSTKGESLTGAAIIIGLVSIVALVSVIATGDRIKRIFGNTNSSISTSMSGHSVIPNPTPVDPTPVDPPPPPPPPANDPPVWSSSTNVLPRLKASQSYSFDFSALASDPNGDTLTYSVISGSVPPDLTLATSGLLSGTGASSLTAKSLVITVRVSDGKGGTADKEFSIPVGDISYRYYRLLMTKGTYSNVQLYDFRLKKTDSSFTPSNMSSYTSGAVTVSASVEYDGSYPAWYAFDSDLGSRWASNNTYIPTGSQYITVDLGAPVATTAFRMYVHGSTAPKDFQLFGSNDSSFAAKRVLVSRTGETFPAGVTSREYLYDTSSTDSNQAPSFSGSLSFSGVGGRSPVYQLTATDPDGDAITYSAVTTPPGSMTVSESGVLSGTLPTTPGTYTFTARAIDSLGSYTDATITIEVRDPVAYRYYQLMITSGSGYSNVQIYDARIRSEAGTYFPNINMTSASTSGFVVSSNYNMGAPYEPYSAFDSDLSSSRWVGSPVTGTYLNIDMGASNVFVANALKLTVSNTAGQAPRTFAVYGADNPSMTGKVMLFQTTQTWPASLTTREFLF